MEAALVKVVGPEHVGLTMHCAPAEARRRMQELQAFIAEAMDKDVDYGVIPGTQKPTLFQPGAQKLCEMYGLAAHLSFDEMQEDWDKPFFYYRARAVLTDRRTGAFVGEGIGSCNSREKKYAGRWVAEAEVPTWLDKEKLKFRPGVAWLWRSKIPAGVDIKTLKTEERPGKKEGETYTVYALPSNMYFCPNEEAADLVNTFQKMAIKRALVGAVNGVTRSSGIFTQDIEDLPPEAFGYVEQRRGWEGEEPEAAAKAPPKMETAPPPATAAPTAPDWAAKLKACGTAKEVNNLVAEMVKHFKTAAAVPQALKDAAAKRREELSKPPVAPAAPATDVPKATAAGTAALLDAATDGAPATGRDPNTGEVVPPPSDESNDSGREPGQEG